MHLSSCDRREYASENGRLYFFDNAKFLLIFLVVVTHFLEPMTTTSAFCRVFWITVNAFHMPAFIFISGFFAKSYISAERVIKVQRTATYLILFLTAQIAVFAFERFVLHEQIAFSLVYPRSSLWFLQCLILWHLALPFIARFRAAFVIPAVIVFALYIGYEKDCGAFLSLSRVFVHFPFFLCGYYCSKDRIQKLFCAKARIPLVLLSAALIAVFATWQRLGYGKVITAKYSYDQMHYPGLPFPLYWVARLAFYLAAFVLAAAFFSLVPRGKRLFTSLGAKSLSVYILHRFVHLAEVKFEWYSVFQTGWGIAALFGIALVLTILFSVKPFTIPFDALQTIRIRKLLRSDSP